MLAIPLENLDITKTYVVNEIGNSEVAKIIQGLQHRIYKKYIREQLPTHTFAIFYKNNQWMVFENHAKHNGIKIYPVSEYESDAIKFYINQYDLNLDSMEYWNNHNMGYSIVGLCEVVEKRLLGIPLPDAKGWYCTQSVVACNFKACNKLKIGFDIIAPADLYYLFNSK